MKDLTPEKRFDEWVKTTAQQHEQLAIQNAASQARCERLEKEKQDLLQICNDLRTVKTDNIALEARCERLKAAAKSVNGYLYTLSKEGTEGFDRALAKKAMEILSPLLSESPSDALTTYCQNWGVSWERVMLVRDALIALLPPMPLQPGMVGYVADMNGRKALDLLTQLRNKE